MSKTKIGDIEITRTQAEAEIRRALRAGRRPPRVYMIAMEHFRSADLMAANQRPKVWNF